MGVEGTGGGELAYAGLGRRILGQLLQRRDAAGGDDLSDGVAVGGNQFEGFEALQHLCLVAAQHGRHTGGVQRAGLGHLGAAGSGQGDGLIGRDDPGDGIGGDLAHGVAGDDGGLGVEVTALVQLVIGQQGQCDDQRLGDGGVGDLLGGGGGSQAHQIESAGLRPLLNLIRGTGQFEPRGQHAGGLGSLSGSEQCNHVFKRTL
ncbi:Uncharacterised protein [Mycobacteroides abscessus subsp. abscessus]|nr:Uncharacterised protein [Mycobacteroides abscessus subsp. abscessus]